jgi:hypothetical protein
MAFDASKTSTFLSMMQELLLRDIGLTTAENSSAKSFLRFEEFLLKHSVDRPPKRYLMIFLFSSFQLALAFLSVKIFDRDDIEKILEFVSER